MNNLKSFFRSKIESVRDDYLKDLDSMSHEALARRLNETARSGYDFTYEVILVNKRIATRLRGETPPAWPDVDGFLRAPEEWQDKEKVKDAFQVSMDEILSVWDSLSEDAIAETEGDRSPANMAYFACLHPAYHDAQLNYIQSLGGDTEVHW